jgi:hypothetical protein
MSHFEIYDISMRKITSSPIMRGITCSMAFHIFCHKFSDMSFVIIVLLHAFSLLTISKKTPQHASAYDRKRHKIKHSRDKA